MVDMPAPLWDCHVHVFDAKAPIAPGHYTPAHRPLRVIEALAQANGFGHLVLVQPSVYGTDNTVLLEALRASPGRHRGVVVIDQTVSNLALQDMHALGVRGVRFNLVSPVTCWGGATQTGRDQGRHRLAAIFGELAPRLQAFGWHVQWYAHPDDLQTIVSLHARGPAGLVAVLDHLAGLHAGLSLQHPAWLAVARLAASGAWVKLSGWYRLRAAEPYATLDETLSRVAALFGERMVWGSDWPHTSFSPGALPDYATTWAPVVRVLPAEKKNPVWHHSAALLYA